MCVYIYEDGAACAAEPQEIHRRTHERPPAAGRCVAWIPHRRAAAASEPAIQQHEWKNSPDTTAPDTTRHAGHTD